MKPLVIDLFTGLHGWLEAFLQEGYQCRGYDIEDMCASLGIPRSSGIEFIRRDVRSITGAECKDAAVIVASPPCQAYSYRAMPWKRAKALPPPDNTLFNECFRIQREASEAAGRYIPLIVENVRGAQKWVGRARWNYGSFYLWGDVPALMPMTLKAKKFNPDGTAHPPGSWFAIADSKNRGANSGCTCLKDGECDCQNPDGNPRMISNECPVHNWDQYPNPECSIHGEHVAGLKVKSFRFDGSGKSFQTASVEATGIKGIPHRTAGHWTNPAEHEGVKEGGDWWNKECRKTGMAQFGSKSSARKRASAMIAKIPFPLAQHIARVFKPREENECAPGAGARISG